jgi:hypothetical protein
MPMMGSRGGGSIRGFGRFGKNILLAFLDSLSRTTSGTLGTSSDGKAVWKNVRGTWQGSGSAGASQSAASGNNIAVVDLDGTVISNLQVDTSNTSGVGLAFWVTDDNNWWASTTSNSTSAYSYSTCTGGGSGLNPGGCPGSCYGACGGCNQSSSYYVWYVNCSYGRGYQSWTTTSNTMQVAEIGQGACQYYGGQPQMRESVTAYGCSSTTQSFSGTNYLSNFKLLNNAGTVVNTQYNTNTSGYASAGSIAISTVGNVITYSVYSAANKGGSLLHTGAYTATSPTKGPGVGLFHADGGSNQGSAVNNFSVTAVI